ncbi:dioxygenase [Microbacterium sp. 4R-513]|uniref:dioxygenase n=1 Tax=Microbacterium sp. 4R-513 TaxID=2567934 RepID=UPI0013E1C631|nr:dioxygenase [Microbacterium sp. 4R-513]QIG40692.1 dioxygenase [Microbacterium sp. 4R-513]
MATGGKDRSGRESRERARVYQARQQLHDDQARRRRRDNLLAGIIGGILILGVIGVQAAYFTVGPGAPEPSPSVTPSPSITPAPADSPAPTDEPAPVPSDEPVPSPSASS